MLRITFGLHLDAAHAQPGGDRLGVPTLGPLGFLALLEAQLGLGRDSPSHAERVVQYRDCLQRCDTKRRFYHQTFALDELGTAGTLLRWRDRWYLHGWNGTFDEAAAPRLRDMGDVEALARESVSPCEGERLQAVLETFASRRPPIDEVTLVDPLDAFPVQWQRVLACFPIRQATQLSQPQGLGLLGDLQRAVLAVQRGEPVNPIPWRDDDTVFVCRAGTRLLGARWLAERMRRQTGDTLLIAGADALLLDETLVAADLPRQGFREASAWRPSLQLLPIVMALLWEPLDFHAMLAFLTHPVCPLRKYARWRLARKLVERPGVGGERWEAELRAIDAYYGDESAKVRAAIARWVEHARFPGHAPLAAVMVRASALIEFFQSRLGEQDVVLHHAYLAGLAQTSGFVRGLERLSQQGLERISRAQFEQLIAQVTAGGQANTSLEREAGCLLSADDPGAAIEPRDTVFWWQLADPGAIRHDPWSQRELGDLQRCGVALPSMSQRLAHAAESWTRPIRAARRRLELVLPPAGVALHPVWLMLNTLVKDIPVRPLDGLVLGGPSAPPMASAPGSAAALSAVVHCPLPSRRRWWRLPAGVQMPRREFDSYTSLNLLLNDPHQWVLRYAARLKPSDVLTVSDGSRLYGNLAHRLVERAYCNGIALRMDADALQRWLDQTLPALLAEEGAVLLMPGRRADLERFRTHIRSAFAALREQLAATGATQATPEMALKGSYEGGAICGSADLVLRKPDGSRAILDMKWSGDKSYRELLAKDGHLQLVVYAELLRQQTGAWPALAYFVMSSNRLLARSDAFFPRAQVVRTDSTDTSAQLWQRFRASWRWRMEQIGQGHIEVVSDDIAPGPESEPPADGLLVQTQPAHFNDFVHLAGWEAQA